MPTAACSKRCMVSIATRFSCSCSACAWKALSEPAAVAPTAAPSGLPSVTN
jgi:hypothetical protein